MTARVLVVPVLTLALTATAPALAGATGSNPEVAKRAVDGWWAIQGGKAVVYQQGGKLMRLDAKKPIADVSKPIRRVFDLDASHIGCDTEDGFHVYNTVSGKGGQFVSAEGKCTPAAIAKGRDWFCVLAESTESTDPITDVHKVDLKTLTTSRLYRIDSDDPVRSLAVVDRDAKLVVWTENDGGKGLTKHTVTIADGKNATESVDRNQGLWPMLDGKGYVTLKKGKLLAVSGGKEKELFEGKYTVSIKANRKLTPSFLAVTKLTDTNKDGKISASDGDDNEVHLVDLKSGEVKQLADGKRRNEMRGWSLDGQCLAIKRWEPPDIDSPRLVSALVICDTTSAKNHYAFPAKGGLSVRFVGFLPGGWALARDINLLSKDPTKEPPFLFGFRHGERRVNISEPKKKVAVSGKWLLMSDHDDRSAKAADLCRWAIPED